MRIEGVAQLAAAEPASAKPDKATAAAAEFEALLITQMLQSSGAVGGMTSLDGGSSGDDPVSGFAAQQMGQALAKAGGIGLARLVASGLGQAPAAPEP